MKNDENRTIFSLDRFKNDLLVLIRARYPLIYLNTFEESRVIDIIQSLCKERQYPLYIWSRTRGIQNGLESVSNITDPISALKWYEDIKDRSILVLKDFHPFFKEPSVVRKLRDLAQDLKCLPKNIILISPVSNLPIELSKEIAFLDIPLPGKQEIESMILEFLRSSTQEGHPHPELSDEMIESFAGLSHHEIENVVAKSLVTQGQIDWKLLHEEKKQIIKKSSVLEFVDPPSESTQLGGLEGVKKWLSQRRVGFTQVARQEKLPPPKGILLIGIPGCGKSLTAMTVAQQWRLPLLRLDFGRVYSGLVGSSESNIREALKTVEAVSPCILWLDEIEKGLSGAKSQSQGDGGTSSRVFGTILTWMQEKKSTVFVVATANDISALPPELLRKGRFDEIFFVDLPQPSERKEIFQIHLDRFGWVVSDINWDLLIQKTEGFSGAELEQVLVDAKYDAVSKNQVLQMSHLDQAIASTVPLSKTMHDRILETRRWAKDRTRPASQFLKDSAFSETGRTRSLELSHKEVVTNE